MSVIPFRVSSAMVLVKSSNKCRGSLGGAAPTCPQRRICTSDGRCGWRGGGEGAVDRRRAGGGGRKADPVHLGRPGVGREPAGAPRVPPLHRLRGLNRRGRDGGAGKKLSTNGRISTSQY
eukprot:1193505-Prorocentrum_minimum.AAC.4